MPATLELERPQTLAQRRRAPAESRPVLLETPDLLATPDFPARRSATQSLAAAWLDKKSRRATAVRFSLERLFTGLGFAIALGLVAAFGLDLAFAWPFWRASVLFDAAFVVCGIALAYLSWNVHRDQLRRG